MRADQAITEAVDLLRGSPVFLAGSCAAASTYDKPDAYSDLDLFVPTQQVMFTTVQRMLDHGYVMDERFSRVWHRWLKYGFKGWHTNSMKLESLSGVETNVIYKINDGHPTSTLGQVLESFDFGLLARGLDVQSNQWRDMRPYYWPDEDPDFPKPLMLDKEEAWLGGFISQYNGLRQPWRYAHYAHDYGYDLSRVKPVLLQGYSIAASYHLSKTDEEKQLLGQIYHKIGELIEDDDLEQLIADYKTLDFNDPLDEILEALQ